MPTPIFTPVPTPIWTHGLSNGKEEEIQGSSANHTGNAVLGHFVCLVEGGV